MSFDRYFDSAGLLSNMLTPDDPNGGDSAQMMGLYRFGRYLQLKRNKNFVQIVKDGFKFGQEIQILTSSNGLLVRHPQPIVPIWASDPFCTSRDQQRSVTMAAGPMKQPKTILKMLWRLVKRGGFYENVHVTSGSSTAPSLVQKLLGWDQIPDYASPDNYGEIIRSAFLAGVWPVALLYPILVITDLFATVGLLINFLYTWKQPDSCDDDNLAMSYLLANNSLPTPISWLLWKVYVKYRPLCIGAQTDMNGPQSAFARKHRAETGSPPFYDLYKELLR